MPKKKVYIQPEQHYTQEDFNNAVNDLIIEEKIKNHLTYCLLMAYASEHGFIDVPGSEFYEMGEMLGELVMQRF